jgi:hypothetical protein
VAGHGHAHGISHTCIHLLGAEHTTPLTCTLDFIILSEIGASSALLSSLASCGTSWTIWAGGDLVTLGVCRYLDGPVFGVSSSGGR